MIDHSEIIKRGYVYEEEYKEMLETDIEKIFLIDQDGFTEGLWCYPLEDSNINGQKFHFVFLNNPIMFLGGPREVCGLLGIATSNGSNERAKANSVECLELFKKAGEEAIDYWEKIKNVNSYTD